MMWSTILKILVGIMLVITIYTFLFQGDFVVHTVDAFRNLLTVERDPLPRERTFFESQRDILETANSLAAAFQMAAQPPLDPDVAGPDTHQDFCFGTFRPLDPATFSQHQLIIRNMGSSTSIELYDRALLDYGEDIGSQASPVRQVTIDGVVPCVVYGQTRAKNFYDDLLRSTMNPLTDQHLRYSLPVDRIVLFEHGRILFPVPSGNHDLTEYDLRRIASSNGEDLIVTNFDYGSNFESYYFLKHGECVSLITTRTLRASVINPNRFGGCDNPNRNTGNDHRETDLRCLDTGGRDQRLPNRLQESPQWSCTGFTTW